MWDLAKGRTCLVCVAYDISLASLLWLPVVLILVNQSNILPVKFLVLKMETDTT